MPFTPFHLGPAAWIGLMLFGSVNLFAFVVASIIIDVEPFLVLCLNLKYPLHGFLHTILGSTVIAVVISVVIYHFKETINKFMNIFKLSQENTFKTILFSCLLGVYFHIFLDSFFYSSIKPFFPLNINPFFHSIPYSFIYLFCGLCFILFPFLYVVRLITGKIKPIFRIICFFIFISFIFLSVSMTKLRSPFDDGPFTGIDYIGDIRGYPDSKTVLEKRYLLEIYDVIDKAAPVIVLRDHEGRVIWAKLAILTNIQKYESCRIEKIKLLKVRKIATGYHIKGIASWTYGNEAINFYLDESIKLKEFYLSW